MPRRIFFFSWDCLPGSPLQLFSNLYITEIGGDSKFVGIHFTIQSFSELPFFFIACWLLRKIGEINLLILTMVVTLIRLLLYGIIDDPATAVIVSGTHGLTFALFLLVVVEFVQNRTAPHLRATGQSLVWAFHFGAGLGIGNVLIGWLKDLIGMQDVMKLSAAGIALVLIVILIFFRK